jgi:hypothetical protein
MEDMFLYFRIPKFPAGSKENMAKLLKLTNRPASLDMRAEERMNAKFESTEIHTDDRR